MMSPLYRGRTIVFVRAVRRMSLNREPANGHRVMNLAPEWSWLSRFRVRILGMTSGMVRVVCHTLNASRKRFRFLLGFGSH